MSEMPSPLPREQAEKSFDVEAFLRRAEDILPWRTIADGRRIFALVALALIRRHPSFDGAGEEARLQRAMSEIFGDDRINGRPAKDHEAALIRMADLNVNDRCNRESWQSRRRQGLEKSKRPPRVRGAEKLAEAVAMEFYGRNDETIIRRLKDDFNERRPQILDRRTELLAAGDAEKELAALVIELFVSRGLEVDASVTKPINLFDIEELVY